MWKLPVLFFYMGFSFFYCSGILSNVLHLSSVIWKGFYICQEGKNIYQVVAYKF